MQACDGNNKLKIFFMDNQDLTIRIRCEYAVKDQFSVAVEVVRAYHAA